MNSAEKILELVEQKGGDNYELIATYLDKILRGIDTAGPVGEAIAKAQKYIREVISGQRK